jgi:hypothetical protein
MATVMFHDFSRFAGNFIARCPKCDAVCAFWDDDDLDEEGHLLCHCDEEES